MCLIDTKRFRFTFKRIPIYKVVCTCPERGDEEYFSPIQETKLDKYNSTKSFKQPKCLSNHGCFPFEVDKCYKFSEGYYYAYTIKESAKFLKMHCKLLEELSKDSKGLFGVPTISNSKVSTREYIIVTGYIPAFTRYARGVSQGEICARRMILNI